MLFKATHVFFQRCSDQHLYVCVSEGSKLQVLVLPFCLHLFEHAIKTCLFFCLLADHSQLVKAFFKRQHFELPKRKGSVVGMQDFEDLIPMTRSQGLVAQHFSKW